MILPDGILSLLRMSVCLTKLLIFTQKKEFLNKIVLSDDGNTFDNLSNMGVIINSSPELKELIGTCKYNVWCSINDRNEIFVKLQYRSL